MCVPASAGAMPFTVAVEVSVGSVSRIEAVLTPLVNMAKSGTPSPLKSAATI